MKEFSKIRSILKDFKRKEMMILLGGRNVIRLIIIVLGEEKGPSLKPRILNFLGYGFVKSILDLQRF